MNNYLDRPNYPMIDILKFCFSILVVTIHINPFKDCIYIYIYKLLGHILTNGIGRIAVPFFFTCSGFLLFKKIKYESNENNPIKKYLTKILKFIGIWYVILYYSNQAVLWYLVAIVIAFLIITLFRKLKISFKVSFIISLLLYAFGAIFDTYYNLIIKLLNGTIFIQVIEGYDFLFYDTKNGIFFGLFFIMLGIAFTRKEIKINKYLAICGFILSLTLFFTEVLFLYNNSYARDYNMYITVIPVVFFIFYYSIKLNLKDSYKKLRVYSSLIFFVHMAVYKLLQFVEMIFHFVFSINFNSTIFCIATIVISIVFSIVIEKKSNKYKILCNLYS